MSKPVFIRPYSQADAESGAVRANGIISVRPSDVYIEPRWDRTWFNGRIYAQWFDEGGDGDWEDDFGQQRHGPDIDHIAGALFFARWTAHRAMTDEVHIAVQCPSGLTIAPAICAALWAEMLGAGSEAEVAARLAALDVEHRFRPNPAVVRLADQVLNRQGRLIAALTAQFPTVAKAA
jgi:hypothetical protein